MNKSKFIVPIICLAFIMSISGCGSTGGKIVTDGHALAACKREAKDKAPYGFDYSISDVSINEQDTEKIITFENAVITDQLGLEKSQTIECRVEGTDNDPIVSSFGAPKTEDNKDLPSLKSQTFTDVSAAGSYMTFTASLEHENLTVSASTEPGYSPSIILTDKNGSSASFTMAGDMILTVINIGGKSTTYPSESYQVSFDDRKSATYQITIGVTNILGLESPIQKISGAALSNINHYKTIETIEAPMIDAENIEADNQ